MPFEYPYGQTQISEEYILQYGGNSVFASIQKVLCLAYSSQIQPIDCLGRIHAPRHAPLRAGRSVAGRLFFRPYSTKESPWNPNAKRESVPIAQKHKRTSLCFKNKRHPPLAGDARIASIQKEGIRGRHGASMIGALCSGPRLRSLLTFCPSRAFFGLQAASSGVAVSSGGLYVTYGTPTELPSFCQNCYISTVVSKSSRSIFADSVSASCVMRAARSAYFLIS